MKPTNLVFVIHFYSGETPGWRHTEVLHWESCRDRLSLQDQAQVSLPLSRMVLEMLPVDNIRPCRNFLLRVFKFSSQCVNFPWFWLLFFFFLNGSEDSNSHP